MVWGAPAKGDGAVVGEGGFREGRAAVVPVQLVVHRVVGVNSVKFGDAGFASVGKGGLEPLVEAVLVAQEIMEAGGVRFVSMAGPGLAFEAPSILRVDGEVPVPHDDGEGVVFRGDVLVNEPHRVESVGSIVVGAASLKVDHVCVKVAVGALQAEAPNSAWLDFEPGVVVGVVEVGEEGVSEPQADARLGSAAM